MQQFPQEADGVTVQPRGVQAKWLCTIQGEVIAGELRVLADARPCLLGGGPQDLCVCGEGGESCMQAQGHGGINENGERGRDGWRGGEREVGS